MGTKYARIPPAFVQIRNEYVHGKRLLSHVFGSIQNFNGEGTTFQRRIYFLFFNAWESARRFDVECDITRAKSGHREIGASYECLDNQSEAQHNRQEFVPAIAEVVAQARS